MDEMNVPEDVRKRLQQWLGWKWEEDAPRKCLNLSFTTYNDLGTLKEKLAAEGLWTPFVNFAYNRGRIGKIIESKGATYHYGDIFFGWLLNPVRFALLVDEFLRDGGYYG